MEVTNYKMVHFTDKDSILVNKYIVTEYSLRAVRPCVVRQTTILSGCGGIK